MIKRGFSLLLLVTSSLFSTLSSADETAVIKPFVAHYDLFRQGSKYGSGTRELTSIGDNKYRASLVSELEWLIFSDNRSEHSEFFYKNQTITPHIYNFVRTGTGRDKKLDILFAEDKTLTVKPKKEKYKIPAQWQQGWYDEMTLHLQVQQDLMLGKKVFDYDMISSSGKLRNYKMEVIGQEIISTGLGRFEAIKVERIYDKNKQTKLHAWFIPEFNYVLARLWRIKKGVEQYDLVIADYKQQ